MSAFRISDDTWQNIVDALNAPASYGDTLANSHLKRPYQKIVEDWHAANDRAVANRYREALEGGCPTLKPSNPVQEALDAAAYRKETKAEPSAPLVQYIKSIQCLKYQCSEDVRPQDQEAHDKAMAEMDTAIRILGERLAYTLPEYEKAAWNF